MKIAGNGESSMAINVAMKCGNTANGYCVMASTVYHSQLNEAESWKLMIFNIYSKQRAIL